MRTTFGLWAQTAAIPARAPRPAASTFYVSWLLSKGVQSSGQRARAPTSPPPGDRSIFDYRNTSPTALGYFLADREPVDLFRARMQLYVEGVMGPSLTGVLGFTPARF